MEVPPNGRRRAVAGAAAGWLALVLLGVGVLTSFRPQVRADAAAATWFYTGDHRAAALTVLLRVITAPGLSVFRIAVFAPVVGWLARRRAWWAIAWVAAAVVLIGPVTAALKVGFGRLRPAFPGGGAQLTSLSYPSGHSSGIATLVTVALVLAWPRLARGSRRWWVPAGVVVAVVVGLSRMWLGVHYLTDVLGGWALGIAWSLTLALVLGALPGGRAALPPPARTRVGAR